MIKKTFKKIFGLKNNKSDSEKIIDEKISDIKKFFAKTNSFLKNLKDSIKSEYHSIIEKCKNLLDTNYKLGMRHLEEGSITDAIFRFRFIIKFWPEFYEAYYRLAYCLILKNKTEKAKKILLELLEKDPNNHNGIELLKRIKESEVIKTR